MLNIMPLPHKPLLGHNRVDTCSTTRSLCTAGKKHQNKCVCEVTEI